MTAHLVAALAHPPVSIFELSCAAEIFGRKRDDIGGPWYDFAVGALEAATVASVGGFGMAVAHGIDLFDRADTIIIPSWEPEAVPPPLLIAMLTRAYARGVRIVSICSGALLLAHAGLLDGRRATTHWLYAEAMRRRFPAIDVDAERLYHDDGQIVTAAGSAAGIDMLLHLVRRDHGAAVCNLVARRLNIPAHRDGHQSQYAGRPVSEAGDSRLADLIAWMRSHANEEMAMADLAARAAMSPRTFFRRFRSATGQTPYEWLIAERIAIAKELLDAGAASIDHVAFLAGFTSAETMRLHFRRMLGCTPADYRRRNAIAVDEAGYAQAAE